MDTLFAIRGKMQEIYARHSRVFDKVFQFLLALITFMMINNNIGFMKVLTQPTVTLAMAVICTFFPVLITVIVAAFMILGHMYAASLGILIVTGVLFFTMFVFYFRLTPKKAVVVLLTPLAFVMNVPYVLPIAYALISGPVTIIAIICGTIVYYMMQYVKKAAPALQSGESSEMMTQITAYVKQVFQNKQMWVIIIAFIICFLLVYTLRRQALDHAWKIAIAAGAVVNVVIVAGGNIAMGTHTEYGSLIIGSLAAVLIGMILEFFFFSVDYAKSENLQFEDDEYYYYVKAIPKLAVKAQEKTVKRINERQEFEESIEMADEENDFDYADDVENIDEALLVQSLQEELGIEE